jgi:teichoic acid transport system permease protein
MLSDMKTIFKENWSNRYRLFRLANYEMMRHNRGTFLGQIWNFLNPALQIFVYWFVFAIGMNTAPPRGGYSYLIWMIVGIIPWFYMSGAMMAGTTCIINYSSVITRMYMPLSIVPVKTVLSEFIGHFWAMLVMLAVFFANGYHLTWGALNVFYFALASFVFLIGYALFASAVTVLFRDFEKLISTLIRLLFFISPVVWLPDNLPPTLLFILRLNPFAYLLDGYRESILYGRSLMWHWKHGVYFWSITIILFCVGAHIHMKFRKQFIDLM